MSFIRRIGRAVLASLLLLVGIGRASAESEARLEVDWEQFMQKQDLVWNVLPEYWYESAYMGNGMLGCMIYKEPGENYLRFETGDANVHDHRPEKNDLFHKCRLLTGHFALHPCGEITGGQMRLDLWNAETTADVTTTQGKIHVRSFVHSEQMVIVTQLWTEGEEQDCRWEWIPAPSESPRWLFAKQNPDWKAAMPESYPLNPPVEVEATKTEGVSYQPLQAGGGTAVRWRETREGPTRTLWVTLKHTYPETNARELSAKTLDDAIRSGYATLQETHRAWWHAYYPVSFLTLPDGQKENFYWIQMYKLASATRGDRALMDCTGPWLTVTPWPNAWWNLNVQLSYWPLNASNRLSLAGSLEHTLYDHLDQLRHNLQAPYREGAYGLARSTNFEGASDPVGVPGVDNPAEVGNLTWACHNLWLIYRHQMDDTLLRDKLFPLLKGAINYYLYFLREEEDGKWHLPATFSPEYGSAEDCNYDLSLLRWGCKTLLEAAERLHIDDPLIPKWQDILTRLTPYPQDENGLCIGRDVPYAFSHRHYSHLLMAYPLYLINKETPEEKALIEQSLAYWQSKAGAHQGYSLTGASSLSSALGKGNDALSYLNGLFGRFLSVNTLYRESGPVIETPLSGVQSIHDMLLQSWGGKIRVFPAVPDAWQDVAYADFRTEGAFSVSASRQGGKTSFIEIKSLAGEPCVLVTDITHPVFERQGEVFYPTRLDEGVWQIALGKNESFVVYPEGAKPDMVIRPITNPTNNWFGKKQ